MNENTFGPAPTFGEQVADTIAGMPFLNDAALVTFAWIGLLTVVLTVGTLAIVGAVVIGRKLRGAARPAAFVPPF